MRTVKLYLHAEADLFQVSIIPAARRKRPATTPPVLTKRQWRLWQTLSRLPWGTFEKVIPPPIISMATAQATLGTDVELWDGGVSAHELPGHCIRVIGKTTKL